MLDDYVFGINVVVVVIVYIGYDMEDVMIVNKGLFYCGFVYVILYKMFVEGILVNEILSWRDNIYISENK